MSKNLVPQVAKMLGVEMGEIFKVKGDNESTYKFVEDALIVNSTNDIVGISGLNANMTLVNLLKGKKEIVKLPWKPNLGDRFYTFTLFQGKWIVGVTWWNTEPRYYALLDKGWVFRTKEEAEAALPDVATKIGVEYAAAEDYLK